MRSLDEHLRDLLLAVLGEVGDLPAEAPASGRRRRRSRDIRGAPPRPSAAVRRSPRPGSRESLPAAGGVFERRDRDRRFRFGGVRRARRRRGCAVAGARGAPASCADVPGPNDASPGSAAAAAGSASRTAHASRAARRSHHREPRGRCGGAPAPSRRRSPRGGADDGRADHLSDAEVRARQSRRRRVSPTARAADRAAATPCSTSAPSESLACSEPWLPPPTCAWRPQSRNS